MRRQTPAPRRLTHSSVALATTLLGKGKGCKGMGAKPVVGKAA
jgi:hypothetical protein